MRAYFSHGMDPMVAEHPKVRHDEAQVKRRVLVRIFLFNLQVMDYNSNL